MFVVVSSRFVPASRVPTFITAGILRLSPLGGVRENPGRHLAAVDGAGGVNDVSAPPVAHQPGAWTVRNIEVMHNGIRIRRAGT
jgi:hypothetical protein